ncbi:MAG TPA: hypothetical protein VKK61_07730 [Tepidisphaeraceae bacterium]|nr:hypothetical protein [Tepidisphaeraceae bacterium]
MSVSFCCGTLKVLSRAAAKSAAARFRKIGLGQIHPDWSIRAQTCERCPMRQIHRGISYCGNPLLRRIHREPHLDGCGCPTLAKAQSPAEHCPINAYHDPARISLGQCNCKWCTLSS